MSRTFFSTFRLNIKLTLLILLLSCFTAQSQTVSVYNKFSQLESRLKTTGDTTLLINFWATWCKPCVEELPYILAFNEKYAADKKIKILLVSLNFKNQLTEQVIPFIKEKNIKPEVVLLADANTNSWIPKIDKDWDGAIPVTLLITPTGNKFFHNEEFTSEAELENWIHSNLD